MPRAVDGAGEGWEPADAGEGLRAILNGLPAMVGYWDRDLRNRMANDAYVDYLGMAPSEMRGRHIRDVLGEELFAQNRPFIEGALAGAAQLFDREISIPSGERRYTQASYIPDVVDGAVRGFFVLVMDISARREAELGLHASEERYRTLVEHLPRSAITLVGPDLRLQWLGGGVIAESGLDAEAMAGQPVADTAGGGEHGDLIAALYARALAGEAVSEEVRSHVTGRDFSLDIAPLRRQDGTVEAALGVAQDITDRKHAQAELRLQSQITANMAEGALLLRADDLTIVHANATTEAMFGYAAGELTGRHVSILNAGSPERTPLETAADVAASLEAGAPTWSGEILSVRKDGSTFWRRSTVSRFAHPTDGELVVSVLADVTASHEHDAEQTALAAIATLVAEAAGPAAVFAAVADEIRGLFDAYAAGVIRFDAASGRGDILGGRTTSGEDLSGSTLDLAGPSASAAVFRTGRPARHRYGDLPAAAPVGGAERQPVTGGIAAPVVVSGRPWGAVAAAFSNRAVPPGAEDRLARFARLVALAIANAEAWDTLARQASTDPLTGLANQRVFHERLGAEVERARRYGRDLSVAVLDLDHFKLVNDVHGHQTGDRVLAEFARRLAGEARKGELVARIGGEEFAWLMPETTRDGAFTAAERLRRVVADTPFDVAGTVTVSAGVSCMQDSGDAEQLVQLADRALYWAKDGGRNTTVVYSDETRDALAEEGHAPAPFQTMSSVRALARAIDSKDCTTQRHSERVADLAEQLALQLGWTTKRARLLHACGLLHDVGKIGVPDEILLKPGSLTPGEYETVKQHAALSAYIAAEVLEAEQVAWIRGHHERWDGHGYPDALAGPAIPDGAQLLALADAWDVMTQSRTYQAIKTPVDALAECERERGGQFAPAAVDALRALVAAHHLLAER
jgi:diguanylate cyclase (GGDEF)-like protein/PAS domain S-box-containing protein